MKRVFLSLILIVSFLSNYSLPPLYAYSMVPEFLCEAGVKLYNKGMPDEALTQFKKALMIEPDYQPAIDFIRKIKKGEPVSRPITHPLYRIDEINNTLDFFDRERPAEAGDGFSVTPPEAAAEPKAYMVLRLDENFPSTRQPVQIEQGQTLVILGKNISRFLITSPEIITAEKDGPDELLVTGKDIGYTYLHIWDDNGRWTTELLGTFAAPDAPDYAELLRREEESARNFKLRYGLDWSSFESGPDISNLSRSSYSWAHSLNLTGQTPYGNFHSAASIRSSKISTDLSYLALDLINADIGPLTKVNIYGIDLSPGFSNLAFSNTGVRGAMLNAPVFNNKINYTAFWGREGGGRYGDLSPGFTKIKHSFLEGANIGYTPVKNQNYKFTLVHGYGRDRPSYLKDYAYDLMNNWIFDNWRMGYEIAYDSDVFGHILTTHYSKPHLNLNLELRDIDRDYFTITGAGWRQGEIGGILNLLYAENNLNLNSELNIYKDRLYPAQDNKERLNEDLNLTANYRLDSSTSLNMGYALQNDLGKLSQSRYQSPSLGISKNIRLIRDIASYVNYAYYDSKNFSSPAASFTNNRIYAGMRLGLIDELYYYVNKELNWLTSTLTKDKSKPHALEMGLDWTRRFGSDSPFYGNFRVTYRDEEDTVSNLSLLSGEDYLEGYSELSYRPAPDKEIYGSFRLRNVWAESPNASKRMEVDFNAGMRYLWDTGFHWDSVGNIEGYVFKDLNSDGIMQPDEAPAENITLWLGKEKAETTDIFGHYRFKGVKGKKAYVNLDTSTLPSGFVLTVPVTQEAEIKNSRTARLDFGIVSRSEIYGYIFEDRNNNANFDREDKGISGIAVILDNDKKVITDSMGRYFLRDAAAEKHTVTLDINSVPIQYLPQTAINKELELSEGMSYNYNIPLKLIENKP